MHKKQGQTSWNVIYETMDPTQSPIRWAQWTECVVITTSQCPFLKITVNEKKPASDKSRLKVYITQDYEIKKKMGKTGFDNNFDNQYILVLYCNCTFILTPLKYKKILLKCSEKKFK